MSYKLKYMRAQQAYLKTGMYSREYQSSRMLETVKFEGESRGPDVVAMFAFPPLESRQEDSNEGSDSARAIEIACAKELLSGRETG